MDFSRVHLYGVPSIDIEMVMAEVSGVFPACKVDARKQAVIDTEPAKISDIMRPFHLQPAAHKDFDLYGRPVTLYDGFELQWLFAALIPERENNFDDLHIIFTDLLTCTFSDDDLRYHVRIGICGTPSIISLPGIVEAPAKPKEFYFALNFGHDVESAKKSIASRFIDYGDDRIADAAASFALQSLFFFLTDGKPFCDDPQCRTFNAHWQEDLIRILQRPMLCDKHAEIADKFNRRLAGMKSA